MTVRRIQRRGKVRLVIDIPYVLPSGRPDRYRHDAQVQTMTAARAEERRLLAELGAKGEIAIGLPHRSAPEPSGPDPTVSTFADAIKVFREVVAPTRKPSTRRGYETILKSELESQLGLIPLSKIDFGCAAAIDARLATRKVSTSTRRNVQVVLRSVLRAAVNAELLTEMPRLPPLPKVGRVVIEPFPRERIDALLAQCNPSHRRAFALSIYAGLRAGEVRGLRPEDVDLKARAITVRCTLCNGEEAPPKSGHQRLIPIAAPLAKILASGFIAGKRAALTENGEQWGDTGLGQAFRRVCKRIGIRPYRFHSLRHFFVTELFRNGVSAPAVQALAGHASLTTTQLYAHVAMADLRRAIFTLGGNRMVTGGKRGRRAA